MKYTDANIRWQSIAIILICLVGMLTACETIPPPPQILQIPIATSCIKTVPARPFVHTDPQLAGLDDYKFTLAIFSDRRALLDYSSELEAVLSACK